MSPIAAGAQIPEFHLDADSGALLARQLSVLPE